MANPGSGASSLDQATALQILAALGALNQTLTKVLPVVQSVAAGNTNSTWTGYLNITLPNGTSAQVPYV